MKKYISIIPIMTATFIASLYLPFTNSRSSNVAQAQTKQVRPTRLSAGEIRQLRQALPKQNLIINHAFRVNLPECGSCLFVPTKSNDNRLAIYLVKNGRIAYKFTQSEELTPKSWSLFEINAVSFLQLSFSDPNEDGILILANYITGIGRDGAKPFPVAILYEREGNKGFKVSEKTSQILTSRRVKTVAQAEKILRNELQYLP